ncbi:hypothetical protein [Burkholderia sp. LAS2]|uniref:hypothetical protein n=1 Tax=Burkholderia sp. LAS2 TaxID=2813843 RepID=UPI001BCC7E24|nr:hypothetical protein [Burkholderia sp. LAS2]QVN14594.1 hypothetical protein JYG37_21025 [Burkholderia sp. LAS2]
MRTLPLYLKLTSICIMCGSPIALASGIPLHAAASMAVTMTEAPVAADAAMPPCRRRAAAGAAIGLFLRREPMGRR